MPIEHIREYTIDCTGDVCPGDVILFSETVFGGSHRSPVALGTRQIAATVIRDSYGAGKQQHTFTLVVAGSDGCHALRRGATDQAEGPQRMATACCAPIDWTAPARQHWTTNTHAAAAPALHGQ